MTLLVEKGVFTKTTSTGVPVSQQVNLSNSSLTPKIIVLWTAGQTTSDGTYADHTLTSYGFSDGTNHVCTSLRMHETNRNEQYIFRNDAVISIISLTASSEVSRASVSGTAAGSFTLSWAVQSDTSAMVIHYEVVGGDDITNVSVFQSTHQNFGTGNHSWNGSGTTFTPDFALIINSSDSNVPVNTIQNGLSKAQLNIGAATGTSNQWMLLAKEETGTTSDPSILVKSGSCLGALSPSGTTVVYEGTFVSFNSAAGGGITINITNAASNVTTIGFLLVKGGKWGVGAFQQRSDTGTQDITLTDSTVTPKLVNLAGINSITTGSTVVHNYTCLGASDGTNEGNIYTGNTDALTTWVSARSTDTGKVYRQATPAATATSSTTNAECDMSSMSTAGQFTLNWTTADATQRQMAYWMVGEVAASNQNIERGLTESAITISEASLDVARNKTRTRTETVTATD